MISNFFWPFAFTAAARGTRDRRSNHPGENAWIAMPAHGGRAESGRLHLFEATAIAHAEVRISQRLRRWEPVRHDLKSKAEILGIEIRGLLARLRQLSASRDGRHDGRRPNRGLGLLPYLAFLGLLGLTEYAVNFESFNGWFLFPDSWSTFFKFGWKLYVAAALPSVLLPFFGHVIGGTAKHARCKPMRLTDAIMLGVTAIIALGIIFALAQLRAIDLGRHAGSTGTEGAYWGIFLLNLAALIAGAGLSYIAHSDDPDHEDSDNQERNLQRQLARKRRAWRRIAGRHDRLRAWAMHAVLAIQQVTLCKIFEYRDHNLIGAAQPLSPVLAEEVGTKFFLPREFGTELSLTPPSISEIYDEDRRSHAAEPPTARDHQPESFNGAAVRRRDPARAPATEEGRDAHA